MKAIKELIDYFIYRGAFTSEEIQRMKDLGYLPPDEQENAGLEDDALFPEELISPGNDGDDGRSVEEALVGKRTIPGRKVQKKNELKVSELNYLLGEKIKSWRPGLDGLLTFLARLNNGSDDFRTLSIAKLDESNISTHLTQYLAEDKDFIISLWISISFDGYLGLFKGRSGVGIRIYKMICAGENILDLPAYRFCLKYYNIRLFQGIILAQRRVLKTFQRIFNENPDQILGFIRKKGESSIINTFLLYDIVRLHLLEINSVSCLISEKPFRDRECREFEASPNEVIFTWSINNCIEKIDLKEFSRKKIDSVATVPELFASSDGTLLGFYLKPSEGGTYKTISTIFIYKKGEKHADEKWLQWKKLPLNENLPFRIVFHPEGKKIVIVKEDGNNIVFSLVKIRNKINEIDKIDELANIVFRPDGKAVFLAGKNYLTTKSSISYKISKIASRDIFLYRFPEFRIISRFPSQTLIKGMSISSDGNYLAFFGHNTTIMVWDLIKGELFKLKGHTDIIHSIDFGCHKNILASTASDSTIRLWDMNSRRCFETVDLKTFDKPGLAGKGNLKRMKLALLRNDLVYLDNIRGLIVFKIFLSRSSCYSIKNRQMKKWSRHFGVYWLNRIEITREIIFNAIIMDSGDNSAIYNQLIENEINVLLSNNIS